MMSLLISVIVWGLIFFVLWWGLQKIALPEPFNKIAIVILVVATIIVLINLLSSFVPIFGMPVLK